MVAWAPSFVLKEEDENASLHAAGSVRCDSGDGALHPGWLSALRLNSEI